jgi:hypothetical protein
MQVGLFTTAQLEIVYRIVNIELQCMGTTLLSRYH